MTLDLLITLAIVLAAGAYLAFRFRKKNRGCCGCSGCAGDLQDHRPCGCSSSED
jgi:hypothetical protein